MLEFVDRRNSDSYKWDSDHSKGMLPLWVADMDFKVAPAILQALQQRLDHGVFGYQSVPDEYYHSIARWFSRRHGWNGIDRNNIIYTTGVVPAISAVLLALRQKGNRVLTLTPAYNCFFSSIKNMNCCLMESRLLDVDGHFEIDRADFELKAHDADILLLCNPHNPTGRVWTREELTFIANTCSKNNVFIVSDEIHCELVFPNVEPYVPFTTVASDDNYCVCTSASKAFNIAGLQCANIFVPNSEIYQKIDKAINIHEICDINPFGMTALMAAYNDSESWLDELNVFLLEQYDYLCEFIGGLLPELKVAKMEGTYLVWLDVRAYIEPRGMTSNNFCQQLAEQEKVLFNPAELYGSEGYVRINIATSREVLSEALRRLERFVKGLNAC